MYSTTNTQTHTKMYTWHINIYSIIMEGLDRVLADIFILFFLISLFVFFLRHLSFCYTFTKVSGYTYIYMYMQQYTFGPNEKRRRILHIFFDKTYDASGSAAMSVSSSTESA